MGLANDELVFAEHCNQVLPILEKMNDLLRGGRINLKNQQFRIDANHQTIQIQEKTIAEHKVLIEETNVRAKSIISVAEERAREIEKGIQARGAEINHLEREAKKRLEEADKSLWNSQSKKAVKV